MASTIHSGNGIPETETESEIPATAVEVPSEKEEKPLADRPTVTPVDCVFRVIVPVFKVQSIIGRNRVLINKMCEETKAHINVLEGPRWHPDRVVLISGKEDIEAPLSPAMDAVIRVFKCVNGFPENESDGVASIPFCTIRLLLTSMQVTNPIGMQESLLKRVQEKTGCSTRILPSDEVSTLSVNPDSRVINIQGEGLKVLQALEAVLGYLRMLLHDPTSTLEKHQVMTWAEKSIMHADTHPQTESKLSTNCSPGFVRTALPSITQVTQRMSISIRKATDIIGVGGKNIADIGRRSGAILTVQEKKGLQNEIAIVMKGTSSQVMAAKKLLRIKVRTVKDRDRPAVLNKPTFHPQDRTTAATETPVEPQKDKRFKVVAATTPSSQPHSTPASSYCVMESIKESEQNKRKKCHHNFSGGPSGLELQAAVSLIPPSAQPLPATEAPVEPQKEPEPMVEVPPESPQVQPATASMAIETKRTMSVFEEEILGVLKMIAKNTNKPEPPPKPTFEDCEKKLNELGWPKDDPLHEVAFAIFCDKNDKYRECWMKLHPERCAKWVRMIGRSKSYL